MKKELLLPYQLLLDIENRYPVEEIVCQGVQVWQILRNNVSFAQAHRLAAQHVGGTWIQTDSARVGQKWWARMQIVRNGLWQAHNFFHPAAYWLVSNTLEYRQSGNKLVHKLAHELMNQLGKDLTIFLNPAGIPLPDPSRLALGRHTSSTPFFLDRKLFPFNKSLKRSIQGENILVEILKEYNLDVEYRWVLWDFFSYARAVHRRMQINKPEILFHTCYEGILNQAITFAAHQNGVKVVALQHGLINNKHPQYRFARATGRETFPDWLWTFAAEVLEHVSPQLMPIERIVVTGNYFLETVQAGQNKSRESEEFLRGLRDRFKSLVLVTSQDTVQTSLFATISAAARLDPSICYLFLPRTRAGLDQLLVRENLLIVPEQFDFYQLVQGMDAHLTVYSTCSLEALFLGIPNILLNIDNLATKYFGDRLGDDPILNQFVDSAAGILDAVQKVPTDKAHIGSYGARFYAVGHADRLSKALELCRQAVS